MKILFITRKYPPQIGGMEKYSYNLIKYFSCEKEIIYLNKRQWHLIWFLPYALLKGIFLARKVDLIYLCDSLLAPIGLIIKLLNKKPVFATACGLDITYNNWLYQNIVTRSLKHLDKIIAISKSTQNECFKRGISHEKCIFIPVGIEINLKSQILNLKSTSKILNLKNFKANFSFKNIFVTTGRLVKRKGVAWFCENVMTKLPKDIVYLLVGAGPEWKKIENIITYYKLKNQVFLLGKLSNEDLKKVYAISDIFVMPNIKVQGDMEGFGIVALEATNYNLPVIASDLEGISDAIKNNENGILVQSGNTKEFIRQINILLKDREKKRALILRAQKYNQENFNWQKITQKYLIELQKLI